MSNKNETKKISDENAGIEPLKTCFVIMPIADTPGYDSGHFDRVYQHIIKPACEKAGFEPKRADDSIQTNTIILDILKQIVNADMAICDLSSRNPNVMYELGIRQAFNLPVVLLKDELTNRVFDTSHLRDIPYDHSLRIDTVSIAISKLSATLIETEKHKDNDTHSLISLLGIEAAKIPEKREVSIETSIILDEIKNLKLQLNNPPFSKTKPKGIIFTEKQYLEELRPDIYYPVYNEFDAKLMEAMRSGERLAGIRINHKRLGDGIVHQYDGEKMLVKLDNNKNIEIGPESLHLIRLIEDK